jgi:transposase-like protein
MAKRRIEFDQKQFVRSYLSGRHNIRELARQFGFSESFARKIICGERRPEIAETIDQARTARARRLEVSLTRLGDDAVGLLRKAMGGEPTGSAIAAAREVLRHALVPARPERKPLPEFFYDSPPLTEDEDDDEALEAYPAAAPDPLDGAATPPADSYAPDLTRQDGLS